MKEKKDLPREIRFMGCSKTKRWALILVFVILIAAAAGYGIGKYCASGEQKQLQSHMENEVASCLGELSASVEDALGYVDDVIEDENLIAEYYGSISGLTLQMITVLDSVESSLLRLDSFCRVLKADNVSEFGYLPISVLSQLYDRLVQKCQGDLTYSELQEDLMIIRSLLSELKEAMDAAKEQSQDPVEINFLFLKGLYQNQNVYDNMLN